MTVAAGEPNRGSATPTFSRLHAATVLIDFVRNVLRVGWVVLVAFLAEASGSGSGDGAADEDRLLFEIALAVVGLFGAVAAALRYATTRYAVTDEAVHVRSGVFTKQDRVIPLERVQSVDLRRELLHRLFGVAAVRIDTAVQGDAEALLDCLGGRAAEALRAQVARRLGRLGQGPAQGPASADASVTPPAQTVVWASSWRDLTLAGATSNRLGFVVVAFLGAAEIARAFGPYELWIRWAIAASGLPPDLFTLAALAALLLLGWLASILLSLVTLFGFTLVWDRDGLKRRYGLIATHDSFVPLKRIQAIRLEAPLIRRLLGYASIFEEAAGDVSALERSSPFCPLIPRQRADPVIRVAFPDASLHGVAWRRVSARALLRGFVNAAATLTIAAGLAYWQFEWPIAVMAPMIVVLAAAWAVWRHRMTGYALAPSYVFARRGVLTHRTWIVPRSRVQSVRVEQTALQRLSGLATLRVVTAGARFWAQPRIDDLPRAAALALQDALAEAAHAAGDWTPDGL